MVKIGEAVLVIVLAAAVVVGLNIIVQGHLDDKEVERVAARKAVVAEAHEGAVFEAKRQLVCEAHKEVGLRIVEELGSEYIRDFSDDYFVDTSRELLVVLEALHECQS